MIGDAKRNAVEDVVIDCLREILSKDVDTQNVQTLLDNLIQFLEEAQKHNSNNVNQDFIDLLKLINNYLFKESFNDPIPKMRSFANIPSASVPPFGPSSVDGEFNSSGPSPSQGAYNFTNASPQGSNFNSGGDRRSTSSSSSTSHSRASSTFDSGEQPRASSTSSTSDAAKSEEFVLDRDRAIQTLGLSKQFTKSELNKAYRKKALETHPDKRKESVSEADANEQFNIVKLSYDYLKTDFDPKA